MSQTNWSALLLRLTEHLMEKYAAGMQAESSPTRDFPGAFPSITGSRVQVGTGGIGMPDSSIGNHAPALIPEAFDCACN
ncbi:hypothetical protein [Arthrobacter sp. Br18]|uniref:hypothetical protein n=1 Tax=Arthrobacter sp. Br18 TaxID=1312954 RepID=UPI00138ACAE7|nr:hypothetical protein [Arthrobacter sp. Br18]